MFSLFSRYCVISKTVKCRGFEIIHDRKKTSTTLCSAHPSLAITSYIEETAQAFTFLRRNHLLPNQLGPALADALLQSNDQCQQPVLAHFVDQYS